MRVRVRSNNIVQDGRALSGLGGSGLLWPSSRCSTSVGRGGPEVGNGVGVTTIRRR